MQRVIKQVPALQSCLSWSQIPGHKLAENRKASPKEDRNGQWVQNVSEFQPNEIFFFFMFYSLGQ